MTNQIKTLENLFAHKSRIETQLINVNFKIGEIIFTACSSYSNVAITDIAQRLRQNKIHLSENFLDDAKRVYSHIRHPAVLEYIKRQISKGKFTWNFLVYNCTAAPTGNTQEAIRFWEREIAKAECSLNRLTTEENLPDSIKTQIEGLLTFVAT
jgi:hypothetical protein